MFEHVKEAKQVSRIYKYIIVDVQLDQACRSYQGNCFLVASTPALHAKVLSPAGNENACGSHPPVVHLCICILLRLNGKIAANRTPWGVHGRRQTRLRVPTSINTCCWYARCRCTSLAGCGIDARCTVCELKPCRRTLPPSSVQSREQECRRVNDI